MAQEPEKQKKRPKLPPDVREIETETLADKLFGKRAAKELRKVAQEKGLRTPKTR